MAPSADDSNADADESAQLDAIAAELYALTPDEFTAARNARAAASDRSLSALITALRKPTASAWAVDLLAREGQLSDALELATALREAQDDLDAVELSRLGAQRRALVRALAAQAVDLAKERGVSVSGAARDDVEKTINAAVMDAAAAAAVMTARLVRPLEANGFDPVEIADALGGSVPGVAAAPAPRRDDLAARRARKEAERVVRDAERTAGEADRALAKLDAALEKANQRADLLHERIDDLRADLERLEADAAKVGDDVGQLTVERREAASRALAATKAAEQARQALP